MKLTIDSIIVAISTAHSPGIVRVIIEVSSGEKIEMSFNPEAWFNHEAQLKPGTRITMEGEDPVWQFGPIPHIAG